MASAAPVQVGMASAPPQQTQGAVQVSPGPPPTAAGFATAALDAALQGATCLRLECTAIDTDNSTWTAALRLGDDASAEPAFTLSVEGIGSLKGAPYRAALWPAQGAPPGSQPLVYAERPEGSAPLASLLWGGLPWGSVRVTGNITTDIVAMHGGLPNGPGSLSLHTPVGQSAARWYMFAFLCFFCTLAVATCVGSRKAANTPVTMQVRAIGTETELPDTAATGFKLQFVDGKLVTGESAVQIQLGSLDAEQRRGALVCAITHFASSAVIPVNQAPMM